MFNSALEARVRSYLLTAIDARECFLEAAVCAHDELAETGVETRGVVCPVFEGDFERGLPPVMEYAVVVESRERKSEASLRHMLMRMRSEVPISSSVSESGQEEDEEEEDEGPASSSSEEGVLSMLFGRDHAPSPGAEQGASKDLRESAGPLSPVWEGASPIGDGPRALFEASDVRQRAASVSSADSTEGFDARIEEALDILDERGEDALAGNIHGVHRELVMTRRLRDLALVAEDGFQFALDGGEQMEELMQQCEAGTVSALSRLSRLEQATGQQGSSSVLQAAVAQGIAGCTSEVQSLAAAIDKGVDYAMMNIGDAADCHDRIERDLGYARNKVSELEQELNKLLDEADL